MLHQSEDQVNCGAYIHPRPSFGEGAFKFERASDICAVVVNKSKESFSERAWGRSPEWLANPGECVSYIRANDFAVSRAAPLPRLLGESDHALLRR